MLQEQAYHLFNHEIQHWTLAKDKYSEMHHSISKSFSFGDFSIDVIFNPARLRASSSNVRAKIEEMRINRKLVSISESNNHQSCFLCQNVRPKEQMFIPKNDFQILVNPFPIFERHFTIAHKEHIPQQIEPFFEDLMTFAMELPDFAVFYNGANCGASAPFHTHFQAAEQKYFNVINDYKTLPDKYFNVIENNKIYQIKEFKNYLRKAFCIKIKDEKIAKEIFMDYFSENITNNMLNIICCRDKEEYLIFVFPRKTFRPTQFYEEDKNKRLSISPASVELSGKFILIFQEQFDRITKDDIVDIYSQLT